MSVPGLIVLTLPYVLLLALIWVLLSGRPSAEAQRADLLQQQVSSLSTQHVYDMRLLPTSTPTSCYFGTIRRCP